MHANLDWPVILFFYGCCAVLGAIWYGFWRLTNRAKFRTDEDATTEIGYEEDSLGRVIKSNADGDDTDSVVESPHVHTSGNLGSGPM